MKSRFEVASAGDPDKAAEGDPQDVATPKINVTVMGPHRLAGPYPPQAYAFVQSGLRHTIEQIRSADPDVGEEGRHVSGRELCLGLRAYAKSEFGLLARTVLEHWSVLRTEDFGRIVFSMVDAGLLRKTDEDSLDDFRAVYHFDEAFQDPPSTGSSADLIVN